MPKSAGESTPASEDVNLPHSSAASASKSFGLVGTPRTNVAVAFAGCPIGAPAEPARNAGASMDLADPRSIGEALKGSKLGEFWKYRVGSYRIIGKIEDGALRILVVKVGDRKSVYR